MADTKITALTALTAADPANDVIPIVDVSDTSMAASGTTKKISVNNILGASGTATLASATITGAATVGTTLGVTGVSTLASAVVTGDLTVDTSTLKVDSANDRVGIGTASPAAGAKLGVFGATSVSTSDYIGSSTYAARFIGSSNGASSGISFLTNSASGQSTPASIHATPIADYRSALVATFSADASGAGYFAVNQFSPVGSSTFERFRVNRNGAVVLGGGTVDANGVGIAFPATQVASSDANTLDDYEEGTWTPHISGTATYTAQAGVYTKVGRLVTATFDITILLRGTGDIATVSGLPFSASANVGAAVVVSYFGGLATSAASIYGYVNSPTMVFTTIAAGGGTSPSGAVVITNGTRLAGTAVYMV